MKYFVFLLFALSLEATAIIQAEEQTAQSLGIRGKSGPSPGYGPATAISEANAGNIIWLSDCTGRVPNESKSR
jgi:hypothetical protein